MKMENFLKILKRHNKGKYAHYYFNQREIIPIKNKLLRYNDIPLGFSDREANGELMKLRLREIKPKTFFISGAKRGAGKSRLMSLIGMDYMCEHFKFPTVFIDPKHELHYHSRPHAAFESLFEKIGLTSKPVSNLVAITPKCMKSSVADGSYPFALDSSDLDVDDLYTLLNMTDKSDATSRRQLQAIIYGDNIEDLTPDEINKIKIPSITTLIKRVKKAGTRGNGGTVLLEKLTNAWSREALQPNNYVDVVDLLSKGKNVILQTSTDGDSKTNSDVASYIAHVMKKVSKDRQLVVDSNNKQGKIKKPVMFYLEEFNIPYPRIGRISSVNPISKSYDVLRYAGVGLIGASPSFHSVNLTAMRQSDYLLTFQFRETSEAVVKLMRARLNYDDEKFRMIQRLDFSPFVHPRGEAALIDGQGNVTCFFPLQPLSLPQQEQSVSRR